MHFHSFQRTCIIILIVLISVPDSMNNIIAEFDDSSSIFNSISRILTIPITISWSEPTELYGVLQQYSVFVEDFVGEMSVLEITSVAPNITSVDETVMVMPAEMYVVTVVATTGGGNSTSNVTIVSPDAGIAITLSRALKNCKGG